MICCACYAPRPLNAFRPTNVTASGRWIYCDSCLVLNPDLATPTCTCCNRQRRLSAFPEMDVSKPCSYCRVEYSPRITAALARADVLRDGFMTAGEVAHALGFYDATKSDLNATAKWLRASGFEERVVRGVRGFRVTVGRAPVTVWTEWASRYPEKVADLDLPLAVRRALDAGGTVPAYVKYAIAALSMGLPVG